jgi:hydrogenase-4 membrane subunit HyfE
VTPDYLNAAAPGGDTSINSLAGIVDVLAVALLATGLLSVMARRLETAIWLLVAQGVLLAATAGAIGVATGAVHVYAAAALTVAVKVGVIPVILFRVLGAVRIRREVELALSTRAALVIALAGVLVAYRAAGALALPGAVPSQHALPVAVSLMLIGLGLMIGRKKALSQIAGLIIMENGVYLAALVATFGLPLAVELGVFFDLLVGVLLLGVFAYRINQTFDTIDTDRLRALRG